MALKHAEPALAVNAGPDRTDGSGRTDLRRRIWITLGALIAFRVGTHIPVPGIDPGLLNEHWWSNFIDYLNTSFNSGLQWPRVGTSLEVIDVLSGGALQRLSVFSLSLVPYVVALVVVQLLAAAWPAAGRAKDGGTLRRQSLHRHVRFAAVAFAALQGLGLAMAMEGAYGYSGPMVPDPGWSFRATTMVTLAAGTLFLMWLGDQITARGLGHGPSLILFAGVAAGLPEVLAGTLDLVRVGAFSVWSLLIVAAMPVVMTGLIVFMEKAHRRVLVEGSNARTAGTTPGAQGFPLRLNPAGMIPLIAAVLVMPLPLWLYDPISGEGPQWLWPVLSWIGQRQPLYLILYGLLIALFCIVCRADRREPVAIAQALERSGKAIRGAQPGIGTARHLAAIQLRLTTLGALYLAGLGIAVELLAPINSPLFAIGAAGTVVMVLASLGVFAGLGAYVRARPG